jgi:hypothetical protein
MRGRFSNYRELLFEDGFGEDLRCSQLEKMAGGTADRLS